MFKFQAEGLIVTALGFVQQQLIAAPDEQFQIFFRAVKLHVDDVFDAVVVNRQQFVANLQAYFGGDTAWFDTGDAAAGEGGGVEFLEKGHLRVRELDA
ncbi:MAG: hypothetical protein IPF56_15410 [Chloroflexi bacterium]|nr:hypothetical protein [Chloroflexota bacterium]